MYIQYRIRGNMIKKEDICGRCKKNKATIDFTESSLHFSHGFIERICKKCFEKIQKEHPLYKKAYKQGQKDLYEHYFKGIKNPMIIGGEYAKKVIKDLDDEILPKKKEDKK